MIKIYIYTDGSCIKNPGPGGCAAIVIFKKKQYIFKAGYFYTTNNRMELMAFILPMRFFLYNNYNNILYIIFTDSNYLYKGVNEWLIKWKCNNWKNSKNKLIKNIDLWIEINYFIFILNNIKILYIKGHSNNFYNKKCDKIAFLQAKNPFLYDLNPPIK